MPVIKSRSGQKKAIAGGSMEAAAELLPLVWPSPNVNWGRPTSLAAKGYIAKALQQSASPLFNQQSTGNSQAGYDDDLLGHDEASVR